MLQINLKSITDEQKQLAILQYKCDRWLEIHRSQAEQMLRMHGDNACSKPDGPVIITVSLQKTFHALSVRIHLFQDIQEQSKDPINSLYFEMGLYDDTAIECYD